ncbi:MAG TPA: molybdate ABC transporter substrate-binding protein [Anaerolineae bacterium]
MTPATTSKGGRGSTLIVFAAASLTESFTDLGRQFEAGHPGVRVAFNFGGSQLLRAQLEHGASADVFASANGKEMDAAVASGIITAGKPQIFARNQLMVIYPKENPGRIAGLADLGKPGLKLDLAAASVPAGQYALDMLTKMSQDPQFGPLFADQVKKNVVSYENDVKAVVSKVRLGEADAGVVYATDVVGDPEHSVTAVPVPDKYNQTATYPIARVEKAAQPDLADQFVAFVLSAAGQQTLARYGFIITK